MRGTDMQLYEMNESREDKSHASTLSHSTRALHVWHAR
eukprot:CAMPEP_0173117208 /NCGR_PEP_ID=MMETSP1102-20130122/50029_1 /TAXON_ID=49646 /ORGANISM="Geminigera sp., Strain Caron Lab Isolate" /LENGTH=37 /DNA_ID= /DNA_START= /DNA_END= /DNA_ORIENTATION=